MHRRDGDKPKGTSRGAWRGSWRPGPLPAILTLYPGPVPRAPSSPLINLTAAGLSPPRLHCCSLSRAQVRQDRPSPLYSNFSFSGLHYSLGSVLCLLHASTDVSLVL
ncbi:hypothetical protein SEVIR_9G197300v4 [Setaria viridis]|uniref:Uncharacterized protein n=1 Tax=Setaria viridis TaxID=4556 RepID=A0A4U6SXZ7_SETVI|nr:hypothetical protein SEVIR_9G197300v2 [Setaria viridis]